MADHANRRQFLTVSFAMATAAVACPAIGRAHARDRSIAFYNLRTGESLKTVFWQDGDYVAEGLHLIDVLLRDFRTGEVKAIDPKLVDLLYKLGRRLGARAPFHVVSGYRSPETNALLRRRDSGVAKRSYHLRGMAVDGFLPGPGLGALHRAALSMKAGGVGYYPKPGFVHLDTGRVRSW